MELPQTPYPSNFSNDLVGIVELQYELQKINAAIVAFARVHFDEAQKTKFNQFYQEELAEAKRSTDDTEYDEGGEG